MGSGASRSTRVNRRGTFVIFAPKSFAATLEMSNFVFRVYRIMKSLARAYVLLAAHPALAAVLFSASGFAVFICIRLLETKERRTERLQRKQQRELKALTERISAYARNIHKRFPRGEVVVGEKDLAEQLRKHPESVADALNVLLAQRKVQKVPLSGYWKLNV
jgi:predicted nucleic acid-binding protein